MHDDAGNAVHARRAQHFFSENRRVSEGVKLWGAGDLAAFGSLINQSSLSSLRNYEVRVPAGGSAASAAVVLALSAV